MWEIKKNNYLKNIYIVGTRITTCISQGDFLGIIHWIVPIIKRDSKEILYNMLCV